MTENIASKAVLAAVKIEVQRKQGVTIIEAKIAKTSRRREGLEFQKIYKLLILLLS